MELKLGQLFLLRRDLKQEITNLANDVSASISYREDKDSNEAEFKQTSSDLEEARKKLHLFDMLIEQHNAKPDAIDFKEEKYSLNQARHFKVHLVGILGHFENLVRVASRDSKKTERDIVWELADPNNTASQMVQKNTERKYIVVPDLKDLRSKVKELKQDVQLLDSLIQTADWRISVEIPD